MLVVVVIPAPASNAKLGVPIGPKHPHPPKIPLWQWPHENDAMAWPLQDVWDWTVTACHQGQID